MLSLDRLYGVVTTPRRLRAAAILRIGVAALTAVLYLTHAHERAFMWGIHGQIEWSYYSASIAPGPFTLYAFGGNPAWPELLYWAGLGVSILFMLGVFPRLTSLLFFASTASLYSRNAAALDGGQNLLILLALYLCFSDSGAYFSLTRDTLPAQVIARLSAPFSEALAVVHNLAMFVIAGQVCLVYYWSGFYKIGGHKWQDGTAVYYVMRTGEFTLPQLSRLVYENPAAVMILTYSTLLFQGAFPFLMWVRRAKPLLFVGALCFHVGIGVFMGLALFSATMVVADLSIFSDSFYASVVANVRGFVVRRRLSPADWRLSDAAT